MINYTEKDISDAFRAGHDSQFEDEHNLDFYQEREKYIKELREVKKLEYAQLTEPSKQGWIDVKTPPKTDDSVVIWVDIDGGDWISGYYHDGKWYNDDGDELFKHMTHYQIVKSPK